MKKPGTRVRGGVFVALAALTLLLCHTFPNAATNPETGMVMCLPERIPGGFSVEVPIGELEKANLPEDTTILRRVYREYGYPPQEQVMRQLTASLVLMGSDRRSLHEPEFCLRGLGWEFKPGSVVTVETAGGPLEVMELEIKQWARKRDGSFVLDERGKRVRIRGFYYYWWVARDGSTPHSKERIARSALNNMFRNVNDRWGYPSVQVMFDFRYPLEKGRAEARARALDFIRTYSPKFQKSLGATAVDVSDGTERGDTGP